MIQGALQAPAGSRQGQLLCLVGPSGVGKTALASQVLRDVEEERGPDSTVRLSCLGLGSDEAAGTLAERLGVSLSSPPELAEAWATLGVALSGRGVLFFDDAHFDLSTVAPLLKTFMGVVVVTRHLPSAYQACWTLPVEPFPVCPAESPDPGWDLFCAEARRADLRFDPGSHEEEIGAILSLCEGFPLAISLSARQSATLSCATVLGLLQAAPPIQAAAASTLRHLSEVQLRHLYAGLLLPDGIDPELLSQVLETDLETCVLTLQELVQAGVLSSTMGLRVRPLFDGPARERFEDRWPDQAAQIQRRLVQVAVSSARQVAPRLVDLNQFDDQGPLWDAAVELAAGLVDDDLSGAQLGPLLAAWARWIGVRSLPRARERLTRHEALFEEAEHSGAWLMLAWVHTYQRAPGSEEYLERARRCAATPAELHDVLVHRAQLHNLSGEPAEARARLAEAAATGEPTRYFHFVSALVHKAGGDDELARDHLTRAARMIGPDDHLLRARWELLRGTCEEDPRVAQERMREARRLYSEVNALRSEALCCSWLGTNLALDEDRFEEAWEHFAEARRINELIGRVRGHLAVDSEEAAARLAAGDFATARRIHLDLERRVTGVEVFPGHFVALVGVAAELLLGDPEPAIAYWQAEGERWIQGGRGYLSETAACLEALVTGRRPERLEERADPATVRGIDALLELRAEPPTDIVQAIQRWPSLRALLFEMDLREVGTRLAIHYLRRHLPPPLSIMEALERAHPDSAYLLLDDLSMIRGPEGWTDLSSMATAATILKLLASAEGPLDFEDIGDHLYPDEVLTRGSLVNRVNVQVSKLRKVGLRDHLLKVPEGFRLTTPILVVNGASPGPTRSAATETSS